MEVFVARQPIYNQQEEVFAYELLYRNNHTNSFPNINGNQATTELIINSLINIGFDSLSEGKPCFINFTENLLHMRLPTYLNPLKVVVEILNSVPPSRRLLDVCKELKMNGFEIALDNYSLTLHDPFTFELLQYVDYMKVDFLTTSRSARKKYEQLAKQTKTRLIAERIEKNEDYREAKRVGYEYFQGYLFSRPFVFSACVTALKFELSKLCFTRARMCEELVKHCYGPTDHQTGAFLAGMLSIMHTMNNVPTESFIANLPLSEDMHHALKGKQNEFRQILDLIQAIEQVEWKQIQEKCAELAIHEQLVFKLFAETQTWYQNLFITEENIF